MRWVGDEAYMGDIRNAYKIKIDLNEMGSEMWSGFILLRTYLLMDSC
jgi:hypothetical protein